MADQSAPLPQTQSQPTHVDDVGQVSHDLKRLLANSETARLDSEVRAHIESLDAWTDTYLAGLEAAHKIAESAGPTLAETRKELESALEQYLRLEDEGGNPATPEQQRHTDELSRALRRLHGLIPAVAQTFSGPDTPETDPQPDAAPEPEPGLPPEVSPPLENPTTPPDVQPMISPVTDPKM